jgi:hypothetical protein
LSLENGLLHVELVREVPEAMKPRSIPIASSSKLLEVKPTKEGRCLRHWPVEFSAPPRALPGAPSVLSQKVF